MTVEDGAVVRGETIVDPRNAVVGADVATVRSFAGNVCATQDEGAEGEGRGHDALHGTGEQLTF
jgi:hypothetical protein